MTADFGAGGISRIFAGPRKGHLDQRRCYRGEDHNEDCPNHAQRVVPAIAAKKHGEGREHRNRPGDGRGNRHDQGVTVPDMGELMRHDAGVFPHG